MNAFPLTSDKVNECIRGFEVLGFPQCLGAMGWYSIVLFALVDYRYRFLYINVGYPGRVNDSFIFENSSLKSQLENCVALEDKSRVINGVKIPVLILGDSAFRFSTKVMKPYPYDENASIGQKTFNYQLSKCRRVVENAFGQLKARFRRIGKGIDNKIENVNSIIRSCCVLHNFLNEKNDVVEKSWVRALKKQHLVSERQQPEEVSVLNDGDLNAEQIRRCLATFFSVSESSDVDIGSIGGEEHGDSNDVSFDDGAWSDI
ncbi:uncharacterized protein LOC119688718 [Teleopsis dalmanni]|uniref:uncharacterized protein LOC119688718 n=1 Tax=Teleopsis dalmanni TaxID=139649 RepID=UPI0018CCD600|nr:uncharacterized protein LOC119688718 [Teleopsis dalmanni]